MRGKRSKQYRKLMNQYGLTFGFREPYQVLIDAEMIRDTYKFKMDLAPALERTLHGQIKPMITQCSMRHLYTHSRSPDGQSIIQIAQQFERRRCDHHTLDEPLSTTECWRSVIDPKSGGVNKHRYVVATQDGEIRKWLRGIPGVPLIYVSRSVMILEPMAESTEGVRDREEKEKFRHGVSRPRAMGEQAVRGEQQSVGLGKRKRGEEEVGKGDEDVKSEDEGEESVDEDVGAVLPRKPVHRGPKQVNPLSAKRKQQKKKTPGVREPRKPFTEEDRMRQAAKQERRKQAALLEGGGGSSVIAV